MADSGVEFYDVLKRYERGDPRPLAEWVKTNELTDEQRQFIAQVICGEIDVQDRRRQKRAQSEVIERYYTKVQFLNMVLDTLTDGDKGSRMSDSEVAKQLADLLGYQDDDSVRRAISRYKKRMRECVPEKKSILRSDETGHD